MGSWSTEARVGAFVLLALAVLGGFVVALGDFTLGRRERVLVDFGYTGGLQVGAPVRVSGIRVGKVGALSLVDAAVAVPPRAALGQTLPALVRAELLIDADASARVTRSALFYVGMQGVIGEAYVELAPNAGEPLPEGEPLRGVDAPRLHVIALQLAATLETFHRLVGTLRPEQLDSLGKALASLVSTVDGVVGERKAEISAAVGNLIQAADDVRSITAALRVALADGGALSELLADGSAAADLLRGKLPGMLERAERSMVAVEALSVDVRGAAADGKALLARAQNTAQLLEQLAEDAHDVVRTVRQGQGSVGALINDPQLYDDMKEMMRDLRRHPWKVFWRD